MDIDDILRDFEADASAASTIQQKSNQLNRLVQAMINERMSPDLLYYEEDLISQILENVRSQVEFIELNSIQLQTTNKDIKLQLLIIESEIERVNYLVRLYLRTRLSKIDANTLYITQDEYEIRKLSSTEVTYMNKHFTILANLYNSSFLKQLPPNLQLLDDNSGGIDMVVKPDLEKPVFIKVINPIPHPIVAGNEEIDLEKNGIYVVRYSSVQKYVHSKDIVLI